MDSLTKAPFKVVIIEPLESNIFGSGVTVLPVINGHPTSFGDQAKFKWVSLIYSFF